MKNTSPGSARGVDTWNAWRRKHPNSVPDLSEADLTRTNLCKADLRGANLVRALLSKADLRDANLKRADLTRADLAWADLRSANLRNAILYDADLHKAKLAGAYLSKTDFRYARLNLADLYWTDLYKANFAQADLDGVDLADANLTKAILEKTILKEAKLSKTNFTRANLRGADLTSAILIETNLTGADLTSCRVYGISAWDLELKEATQRDLVITKPDEPEITVDDIEVGQFIYLLLHNEKIRHFIDTITSKVVLILGSFKEERKVVLHALREEVRNWKYLPVLFDFEKPKNRTTDETITLLARMARFVIADITNAKSVLQELRGIVPETPSLAVQPIIVATQEEPGMFDFYRGFQGVLPTYYYTAPEQLIAELSERVIGPAEAKVRELRG